MLRKRAALFSLAFLLLSAQPGRGQELDRETAAALGNTPPNQLKACVLGGGGVPAEACPPEQGTEPLRRIRLEWKPPSVGKVSHYEVYRYRVVTGNTVSDLRTRVALCGAAATPSCGTASTTSFVDTEALPNGVKVIYFVIAEFDDGTRSGPSNFATITAVE